MGGVGRFPLSRSGRGTVGSGETGLRPVSWAPCGADWIPAYAGMTVIVGGAVRRMAVVVIGDADGGGVPAYAGMTVRGGMTVMEVGSRVGGNDGATKG